MSDENKQPETQAYTTEFLQLSHEQQWERIRHEVLFQGAPEVEHWLVAEVRRLRAENEKLRQLFAAGAHMIIDKEGGERLVEMAQETAKLREEARSGPWIPEDEVARMLKEARAAERERCAKIGDTYKDYRTAHAIRALKDES